ncbi:MAG: glycosyltransferase [Parcubacteria group bacterium]|jgi:glycosyltransferase involved in cell wall biosynthesis
MKILQINKFYYRKGGSESHFIGLVNLLRKNNHEVTVLSTKNKKNIKGVNKDYFVEEIEMKLSNVRDGLKLFYNYRAIKSLEKIIKYNRPDIVHVHNINHHFSPAILKVFKKYDIPVVMTVHDYKLICPNYKLFNGDGICEKCHGGKYYQCTFNKCVKNSYLGSLVMTLEAYWAKWKKYYDCVDIFIAPSQFMRNKLIINGFDSEKVKYLPNFLDKNISKDLIFKNNEKNYILFFGRISQEKGLGSLVRSLELIDDKDVVLKIVGEGPFQMELKKIIKKLHLEKRVMLVGYKSAKELEEIIVNSQFVVVPSLWYENAPYAILESYALSKPVIGAKIGGIPELIKENETGVTFEAENFDDLTKKINYFLINPEKVVAMGKGGCLFLNKFFNKENYLEKLVEIYRKEISKKIEKVLTNRPFLG